MVRHSQLKTLCLMAFLLPLPLLYLLHVEMNHRYSTTAVSITSHVQTRLESQLHSDAGEASSLPSAVVRRILVRETRRAVRGPDSSVFRLRRKCKSRICREFLSKKDMGYFSYCWRKTGLKSEPRRSLCRFLNTTSRAPVALASFPGSGNTWVRGLLQWATGVCTGGIYCDTELRVRGYPGETLRSGRTLVVKTHQVDPRWTGVIYSPNTTDSYFTKETDIPVYDSAIFLVRNPYHALVAEWNRLMSTSMNLSDTHISSFRTSFFGHNTEWEQFVLINAVVWQDTVLGWLVQNHDHRVMVVRFEDLQINTDSEVMMMLDFLGFPYSLRSVARQLRADYSEFRRKPTNASVFDHFTEQQTQLVDTVIENTAHILRSHRLLDSCDVTHYLHHTRVT